MESARGEAERYSNAIETERDERVKMIRGERGRGEKVEDGLAGGRGREER